MGRDGNQVPTGQETKTKVLNEEVMMTTPLIRTESKTAQVICGDCLEVMASMNPDSIDSIVTDPPYGLSFKGVDGKDWDHGVPGISFWEKALKVAKPGAYLLAFGNTKTFHRLMAAIEDAGWNIRDTLMWVYGMGFPKSHNISKAIDKMMGVKHEIVGDNEPLSLVDVKNIKVIVPETPEAKQWVGWGTALKPAWELIIMAQKPFKGTVAENVLKYGTGGLNIDRCRVPTKKSEGTHDKKIVTGTIWGTHPLGRWPANLIHDGSEEVLKLFPVTKNSRIKAHRLNVMNPTSFNFKGQLVPDSYYGGEGSAARIFYCAKASKSERGQGNNHPTVKPITLMRYLVRLVTPPGGIVLDPFCGSGSTGVAAVMEGFRFIGIDIVEEYCEIARKRIRERNKIKSKTRVSRVEKIAKEKLPLFKGEWE